MAKGPWSFMTPAGSPHCQFMLREAVHAKKQFMLLWLMKRTCIRNEKCSPKTRVLPSQGI
jgi:hypothetical protein